MREALVDVRCDSVEHARKCTCHNVSTDSCQLLLADDGATARVARIVNTLDVGHLELSEPLARTSDHPDLERVGEFEEMRFDDGGALI